MSVVAASPRAVPSAVLMLFAVAISAVLYGQYFKHGGGLVSSLAPLPLAAAVVVWMVRHRTAATEQKLDAEKEKVAELHASLERARAHHRSDVEQLEVRRAHEFQELTQANTALKEELEQLREDFERSADEYFERLVSEKMGALGEMRDSIADALVAFIAVLEPAREALERGQGIWGELDELVERIRGNVAPDVSPAPSVWDSIIPEHPIEFFNGSASREEARTVMRNLRRSLHPDLVVCQGIPWLTDLFHELSILVGLRFDDLPS